MDDSKKIKLDIYIGDVPLTVKTSPAKRDEVRRLEAEIMSLYKDWQSRFPLKQDKELLAMIAYQYASYYQELSSRYKEAWAEAHNCDTELDNIENDFRN